MLFFTHQNFFFFFFHLSNPAGSPVGWESGMNVGKCDLSKMHTVQVWGLGLNFTTDDTLSLAWKVPQLSSMH